jgi:hypothetical protein
MKEKSTLIVLILFIWGCSHHKQNNTVSDNSKILNYDSTGVMTTGIIERENISYKALFALSSMELNTLSEYVLEDSGLTISSYCGGKYNFKKQFLKNFTKTDKTIFHFGAYDGSGEDIDLTLNDYIQKCVYTADFLNTKPIDLIKAIQSGKTFISNDYDNILIEHPNCFIKSFHCATDEWKILDIVFIQYKEKWYIAEIRQRCWTI